MKRALVAAAIAALPLLAACGSDTDVATLPAGSAPAATSAPAPTSPRPVQGPVAPAPAAGEVPALTGNPTDLTAASQAQAGTGQPPTELVTKDIVEGTGPTATAENTVDVRYSGTLWSDGTLFDASWSDGNDPISFPLSGVVPGFAQGIEGMKVGGRREIVIPPALGYGAEDNPPIPGNSTLVFVVDLVGVS
jgi:peptidylprolyl isomerase